MSLRVILIGVALLSVATRAGAQPAPPAMDAALLQPHLVDIGAGRRLNFHCVGSGSPTIIFEQGGEGFIHNWKAVQPAASSLTRTCFYDRAGFGWSDPPDKPVTGLAVTDDLRALLEKARVTGPLVFVGHSVGGFYTTLYADRFPDQVAGLVLVDPGFAGQERPLTPERRQVEQANIRQGEGRLLHCAALARAGRLTAANAAENGCIPVPANSTPDEAHYVVHAITRPHWHETEHSQSVNFFATGEGPSVSGRQEIEASHEFGDMPMAVLSAGKDQDRAWMTPDENRAGAEHWRAGHRKLASRSTRGRWSVVPGAGHFIQRDKPDAVIAAIRQVVGDVRARARNARRVAP